MRRKSTEPFVIKTEWSFRTWKNRMGNPEPKCVKCNKLFAVGDMVQPKKNCSTTSHYCISCWEGLRL